MEQGAPPLAAPVPLDEKVAFLSLPATYPDRPAAVEARETRMSWVFLTDAFVYKLKKPISTRHVDLASLEQRRRNCEDEVRLNARLAAGIYLAALPLMRGPGGKLHLGGDGEPVDWLVRMRRLPEPLMLDARIRSGTVSPAEIARLADRLVAFYAAAEPVGLAEAEYLARFDEEQAATRDVLSHSRSELPETAVEAVLAPLERVLRQERGLLGGRLATRRIVEGHGDLRPEHIYLGQPLAVIDCLEFSLRLRLLDPFEEVAFLGMECAVLGAARIAPLLIDRAAAALSDPVPDRLVAFYAAFRAGMRARQAIEHLQEPQPRDPAKWLPLAHRYLAVGAEAAARLPARASG
jgi:aminoglycoside phosphotransferase family enzyme